MKPLFYKGQRIVCVNSNGTFKSGRRNPLIEGKTYTVEDADVYHPEAREGDVIIYVEGIDAAFRQTNFIPQSVDWHLENEITKILHKRNTYGYE